MLGYADPRCALGVICIIDNIGGQVRPVMSPSGTKVGRQKKEKKEKKEKREKREKREKGEKGEKGQARLVMSPSGTKVGRQLFGKREILMLPV